MSNFTLPPLKHIQSPNFSSRNGKKVDLIVIHDCEGSYHGSIAWFAMPKSQVSAHLVLREDGGEVTQMVDFNMKAWHAVAYNSVSIGLEMAGYAKKGFGDSEWETAANIVAYLLHHFGIPCHWAEHGAGAGFCSHYDLGKAGGGHTDPTTDSAVWTHFVGLVRESYALTPPTSWTSSPSVAPPMPHDFVPTPTIRKD